MKEEAGKLSRVNVHSLLSVVSNTPIGPGQTHELSLLDQAMGLHTIHIVFYYGSNPFINGPLSSDLANLRVSLSLLLDHYPTVTGRLARGQGGGWVVKLNDAGVRILHASVDATVDEWLRSADASEERDLTAWEEMPQDPTFWSPFRVQINNFKCGGLAIGLSCSHMHADITSATQLIKSWTEIHSAKPLTHSPIFHLPQLASNNSAAPPDPPAAPGKMSTVTMQFPGAAVERRLSQILSHCPDATPFDVIAALFWSRIARVQKSGAEERIRSISICMDSRSKSIPCGYFGNAIRFSDMSVDAGDLLDSAGFGRLCDAVHRHVAGMKEAGESGFSSEENIIGIYGRRLTFVSGEHMAEDGGRGVMYAAAFREGERPVHVSYQVGIVAGEGVVLVMPSGEGGLGRTVTAVLPAELIEKVCGDEEVLEMEPTMVVSGGRESE